MKKEDEQVRQKKITVITGHYGCGKTNFAVNLAMSLSGGKEKVSVIDLDIVNPYFRTADFADVFKRRGVELISTSYANTNLDIPAIDFDLAGICGDEGYVIIDVGGDDAGAYALGRYRAFLNELTEEGLAQTLYLFNAYRTLTHTPEQAAKILEEIALASGVRAAGLVNSSNLGAETDADAVMKTSGFAARLSEITGLPITATLFPEDCVIPEGAVRPLKQKRYVKPVWEV